MCIVNTHLWPGSWPWACCAPVWPPCSSARVWSDSTALTCSSEPLPGTYPPDSYPERRPECAHQSPNPAGAPGTGLRGRSQSPGTGSARWYSPAEQAGLREGPEKDCTGTWPGCSAGFHQGEQHRPPTEHHTNTEKERDLRNIVNRMNDLTMRWIWNYSDHFTHLHSSSSTAWWPFSLQHFKKDLLLRTCVFSMHGGRKGGPSNRPSLFHYI